MTPQNMETQCVPVCVCVYVCAWFFTHSDILMVQNPS